MSMPGFTAQTALGQIGTIYRVGGVHVPVYGDKAHVNVVKVGAAIGAFLAGESTNFYTNTGIPLPLGWARSGFQPIRGYVPIATTIGLASAGRLGTGLIVGGVWAVRSFLVGVAFEGGVLFGSGITAAIEPLYDQMYGPGFGCP